MTDQNALEEKDTLLKQELFDGAKSFGVTLSPPQLEAFMIYKDLLLDWNTRLNLTAITDEHEVIMKHFVDSLTIVESLLEQSNGAVGLSEKTLIDVGTGAGFPGIPLKILFPSLKVTLLDSLEKRLKFLNEVIDKLRLSQIDTVHARAEDGGRAKEHREKYDFAVARAVAPMPVLLELCLPFVKTGGVFIAMKGGNAEQEIASAKNALLQLKGEEICTKIFDFEQINMKRTIILVRKIYQMSTKYPRKAGKPTKEPL